MVVAWAEIASFDHLGWISARELGMVLVWAGAIPLPALVVTGVVLWIVQGLASLVVLDADGLRERGNIVVRFFLRGIPIWGLWFRARRPGGPPETRWPTRTPPVPLFGLGAEVGTWYRSRIDGRIVWMGLFVLGVVLCLTIVSHVFLQASHLLLPLTVVLVVSQCLLARHAWRRTNDPLASTWRGGLAFQLANLLPVLGPFLVAFWVTARSISFRSTTLVERAHRRQEVHRSRPRWDDALQGLGRAWERAGWRRRWTRSNPVAPHSALRRDLRFRRLCRLKVALALVELPWLGLWLSSSGWLEVRGDEIWATTAVGLWLGNWSMWVIPALVTVGALQAIGAIVRRGRQRLDAVSSQQIGGFAASSLCCAAMGLLVGVLLGAGDVLRALEFLGLGATLLLLLRTLVSAILLFASRDIGRVDLVSLLIAPQMIVLGLLSVAAFVVRRQMSSAPFEWALAVIVCLAPLVGPALLVLIGHHLTHPLLPRHLVEPYISRKARFWLLGTTVTLALPGGGLIVPLCVWMRLRWWPDLRVASEALAQRTASTPGGMTK